LNKNICVFTRTLMKGGAEKQSMLLAKAIKDDFVTYLIVLHGNQIDENFFKFIKKENINFICLSGNIVQKFIKLVIFLKQKKISIIFSYLFSNNVLAAIAGKITKIPYIIGGIRNSNISKFKLIINRFIHNHINSFTIFNNYSGAINLCRKKFKKEKCLVIKNCIEIKVPFIERKNEKNIRILTVARFVPQKDCFTAINSIYYLIKNCYIKKNFKINYYIVGYGKLKKKIEKEITKKNLENYITIVESPYDVQQYYISSDIYLCTSLFEGISNSIIEAMSFSLPIVATNVGDNPLLVREGQNGFLCTIKNYKEIAMNLSILISEYKKRIKMGYMSYHIVKNEFSFDSFKNNYLNFIKSLH